MSVRPQLSNEALKTIKLTGSTRPQLNLYGGTSAQSSQIFSGGTLSDVIDFINIPSYALGGLIDDFSLSGAFSGVKYRTSVSQSIGIKNPWAAFAVDVLTDPLTWAAPGLGALTKVGRAAYKTGDIATTLAGQAGKGQRALFTINNYPVIKGTSFFNATTEIAERLKQISPAYSSTVKALGGRPKLSSLTGKYTLDEIEEAAKQFDLADFYKKSAERSKMVDKHFAKIQVNKIRKSFSKLAKAGDEGIQDMSDIINKVTDPTIKIRDELVPVYDEIKKFSDELTDKWISVGGNILEAKALPNMIADEVAAEILGYKPSSARLFGGTLSAEKRATVVGFKNASGNVVGGKDWGKYVEMEDGTELFPIGDELYTTKAVRDALNKKAKAKDEINLLTDLKNRMTSKEVKNNISKIITKMERADKLTKANKEEFLAALKEADPDSFFTRKTLSQRDSSALREKLKLPGKYVEDLSILEAKAFQVANKAASFQFINQVKTMGKRFANKKDVPAGWAKSTMKQLRGLYFPKELITHIDATYKAFSSIDEINGAFATFAKMQNFWKATATYVNIAFHTRNFISNFWNMYLGGFTITNPNSVKAMIQAKSTLLKFMRYEKFGAKFDLNAFLKTLPAQERQYMQEFLMEGLGSAGAFVADISGPLAKANDNILFRGMGAIGEFVEDSSKLTMYIFKRMDGYSPKMAAQEVRKYLFDYRDLPEFERRIWKQFFPFWTWTRKNLPLQISMLIQDPRKFGNIGKLTNAISANAEGEPLDDKYLPLWLRESFPVYFGENGEGMKLYFKMEGFLPAMDLAKLYQPEKVFISGLSPFIKTPMEMLMNESFFTGREITEFKGQKKEWAGMSLDPKVVHLLQQIRPLNDLQNAIFKGESEDGAKTNLMNYVFGKSYAFDPVKQKQIWDYLNTKLYYEVEGYRDDARENGDTSEVKRLNGILTEIKNGTYYTLGD